MKRYVIEIDQPDWDEEDFDWLEERLNGILSSILVREDYTIQEVVK